MLLHKVGSNKVGSSESGFIIFIIGRVDCINFYKVGSMQSGFIVFIIGRVGCINFHKVGSCLVGSSSGFRQGGFMHILKTMNNNSKTPSEVLDISIMTEIVKMDLKLKSWKIYIFNYYALLNDTSM